MARTGRPERASKSHGAPCPYGHTLRYQQSGRCAECTRQRNKRNKYGGESPKRKPVECERCSKAINPGVSGRPWRFCSVRCRNLHHYWRDTDYHSQRFREYNLKTNYDLSIEDYNDLLESQGFQCGICGSKTGRFWRSEYLHVDHCHETGKVRGLLCSKCNLAIGSLGDTYESVLRALKYLEGH